MKFNKINLQLFAYDPQAQPANYTGSSTLTAEMKTFYDMTLIDEAQSNLVHDQFGQKRPIPANGGKTIEFRKFAALDKGLTPVTEGVTAAGKRMEVSTVTAELNQYGDFIRNGADLGIQFRKVADRFDRQTAGGNGLFLDFHALVEGVYENSLQPILGEVGRLAFAILTVFFIALPDEVFVGVS